VLKQSRPVRAKVKALLLLPLQGVTFAFISTQGVASLALGYVLLAFQAVPVQIRNLSKPLP
jgi:hypothetical protein